MLSYCPFCHSADALVHTKEEKNSIGSLLNIHKCKICAVIYPSSRMDKKEIFDYLHKINTNRQSFKFDNPTGQIDCQDSLVKLLKKYSRLPANALDVGTFEGRFCFILKSIGFKAYGVEPQENAARFARDHGLDVFTGSFPSQLPEGLLRIKFGLISFMESIYYCEDLKESLLTAHDMLADRGLILIKAHQGTSRYYRDKSIFSRYGDYIQWIPTRDSLEHCLKNTGFKIIRTFGINPPELLPLGLGQVGNLILKGVINRAYNRLMLDYTLIDIKKADRLVILAQKI